MKIETKSYAIGNLGEGRFYYIVPDYQREYVWKADVHVEQFLQDIGSEYDEAASEQRSYFIGSIIIIEKAKNEYELIDGQQRLTTIVLTLCAFRDLLNEFESLFTTLSEEEEDLREYINCRWLRDPHHLKWKNRMRLDLQYEESGDFLENLVKGSEPKPEIEKSEEATSIRKMRKAYGQIRKYLIQEHLGFDLKKDSADVSDQQDKRDRLVAFAHYFLGEVELLVIQPEDLYSGLKIFETINERGVDLNAMDLVKNLLFYEVGEDKFEKIKRKWKEIHSNLDDCKEGQSPIKFLRYFLMARYRDGETLFESDVYKWITSDAGKSATKYDEQPMEFVDEIVEFSKRYSDLVNATTGKKGKEVEYPAVRRIGYINKTASRLHLILLIALRDEEHINHLAEELESFLFFSATLGIPSKINERLFATWAKVLREVRDKDALENFIEEIANDIQIKIRTLNFRERFMTLQHTHYGPTYRQRYILGKIENTARSKAKLGEGHLETFSKGREMQIEHILPQTPKDDLLSEDFSDRESYDYAVGLLGNVTLLEGSYNASIGQYNNLRDDWFPKKQKVYDKSDIKLTALLSPDHTAGGHKTLNRFQDEYEYSFSEWGEQSIKKRQEILLKLALETWKINGKKMKA